MSENDRCTIEYRELISGYIDGDIDADDRQRLLAHMAGCADCRRTLEAYRQIGGQVRSLQQVAPPPELRSAIHAATIDSSPRRPYLLSSRLGYSVAAVAAVLLLFVVAVYLLINGYQRSIDPEVAGSSPSNGVLWPLSRPIEVSFNKEMDRESVESALSVVPASERDRLSKTWNGNTLILGQNQSLRPDTSYTIRITTAAEDKWGKNLSSEFRLQFASSDSFALQTPEPLPTETPTPSPTSTPTKAPPTEPMPTATVPAALPTATQGPADQPESPTATPDESDSQPPPPTVDTSEPPPVEQPDPTATSVPSATEEDPAPSPTPTSTATATPTAEPTSTPTPEPTLTPRPLPSPTPTPAPPTATPTQPEPTATPDAIPVVGPFGNVYWSNDIVIERLGAPVAAAVTITGVELDFQHGAMFSRADNDQTYILESTTGGWSELPSWPEAVEPEAAPDPDTWIPGGNLGGLWASEPWIQNALGYALAPSGSSFESRVQDFENGTMVMSSSGQVYVVYHTDGTWELYPDPGA